MGDGEGSLKATYDRRVFKVPENKLNAAAKRLYDAAGTVILTKK